MDIGRQLHRGQFVARALGYWLLVPFRGRRSQLVVATHHKVLTVYLRRAFSTFATMTGRTQGLVRFAERVSGRGFQSDVVFSQHSDLDLAGLRPGWRALHVIRDPRDMLVSACDYHQWAKEPWLLKPNPEYGGLSYQQALNQLETDEERLLFELEHATSWELRKMLVWDYTREDVIEARFESLITTEGVIALMSQINSRWQLSEREMALLAGLLLRGHIHGYTGVQRGGHVQNPSAQKWRSRLTPAVLERLDALFPDAVGRLGWRPD